MRIEGLNHVQLAMPKGEEQAARDFYAGLLAIPEVQKPDNLAKRGGCWFERDALKIHLGVEQDFRPAKKAHPALTVTDLPALIRILEKAGYQVDDDEPLAGYNRCYVNDPFGNRIELMEPTAMDVHDSAAKGFSTAAETYVHGRPDYPPEAVAWLRDDLELRSGKIVLEVGAGTGKFIPLLRQSGAKLLALEPVDAMRTRLAAAHGDVEVLAGTATSIPLPDESVDAIICAQAFHWFATHEALNEFRRVLVSGGMLGLIWNVRSESVPWVAALSSITDPFEGNTPRYHSGAWHTVFPAEGFAFTNERQATNIHVGSPEDVIVGRTLSVSFIAALPEAEKQKVAADVRMLISRTPELANRDEVAFPYETRMFTYRKTG